MAKYKVFNNNNFRVGIRYEDSSNREQTIQPKAFILMDEDDIFYVDAVSQLFKKGVIYLEEKEMLEKMGYTEKSPNSVSEEEIKNILNMNPGKMKAELSKLSARHAYEKVVSVAQTMEELSQTKLKVICDVVPNIQIEDLLTSKEDKQ